MVGVMLARLVTAIMCSCDFLPITFNSVSSLSASDRSSTARATSI